MIKTIPVSRPFLVGKESLYVNNALKQEAISGFFGEYLELFEKQFSSYSDCSYGISVSSGTTALHLALVCLGIKAGDEILVSTTTNMATFFAVHYQGAVPIPIDIDNETWNMNPNLLKTKITSKTRAIIVVHLFGHPVDMDPVVAFAKEYGLKVVEDCAEAHGALYKGSKVGSIGDIGCFSFYANKIITTGEGGMLTTNDVILAEKARSLKSLAFGEENKFMHQDIGFNYRMTNLQAALGVAQLERIEEIIQLKRKIAQIYTEKFKSLDCLQLPSEKPYARNVYWMYHLSLDKKIPRSFVMRELKKKGIETREGFIPYNMQKIFIKRGYVKFEECPVANDYSLRTFYLPSGPTLKEDEVCYVADQLKEVLMEIT